MFISEIFSKEYLLHNLFFTILSLRVIHILLCLTVSLPVHQRDRYISISCEDIDMKKIAGLLLLTAAVILTAGCVTTADPILGSWQTVEPIQYDDYAVSYQLTFEEGGTGEIQESYSDEEDKYIYPVFWEKTPEGTYQYEMLYVFTFSEDGKTMTDYAQYTYVLSPGEEKIGGVWTEQLPKGAAVSQYITYVFNEDGTGVGTYYEIGEEPDAEYFVWEEYAENQIVIRELYTYSFADGKMKTSMGQKVVFEEVDGIWVENPQFGNNVTAYEFRDDGISIRSIYDGETGELVGLYTYYYTPTGEEGGILKKRYLYELALLEDGTLQDVIYGDILERVSPA